MERVEDFANNGKTVIVAALDGTFKREPFGPVLNLVPLAEKVIKLSAVCESCGNEAAFSKRIVRDDSLVLIGGKESYVPLCRECYMKGEEGNNQN